MQDTKLLSGPDKLEHDESRGCYRLQNDWADERPSTAVVVAVATVAGTEPLALPPLRETIDPDALDDLFRQTPGGRVRKFGHVEFSFAGHNVTVDASGEVSVYPQRRVAATS